MEYWEIAKKEAEEKKALQKKYPLLGKKVRRKGKSGEGIVVLDKFKVTDDMSPSLKKMFSNSTEEYFIQYASDDLEQLLGMSFEVWNEEKQKWEDEPNIIFGD